MRQQNCHAYRKSLFKVCLSLGFPARPENWSQRLHPHTAFLSPAMGRTMAPSSCSRWPGRKSRTALEWEWPTFAHIPNGRRNPFIKLWKFPPVLQEEGPWSACKYMSWGLNKLHHYFYILRGVHAKGTRGKLWYLSCRQYIPESHAVSVSSAQANWPAPWPLNGRGVPVPNILFSYCLMIKITPAGRTKTGSSPLIR